MEHVFLWRNLYMFGKTWLVYCGSITTLLLIIFSSSLSILPLFYLLTYSFFILTYGILSQLFCKRLFLKHGEIQTHICKTQAKLTFSPTSIIKAEGVDILNTSVFRKCLSKLRRTIVKFGEPGEDAKHVQTRFILQPSTLKDV